MEHFFPCAFSLKKRGIFSLSSAGTRGKVPPIQGESPLFFGKKLGQFSLIYSSQWFRCKVEKGYAMCYQLILFILLIAFLVRKSFGQVVCRDRNISSTSNFHQHILKCTGPVVKGRKQFTYSKELLRVKMVEWCSTKARPFAIAADRPLGSVSYPFLSLLYLNLSCMQVTSCVCYVPTSLFLLRGCSLATSKNMLWYQTTSCGSF